MTAVSHRAAGLPEFFRTLADCTDKNPLTHGIHPYPAKFIPHIPRELIQAYAPLGLPVLDPMCGSGTAVLEAALEGYPALGTDLNPVATLVSAAKVTPLSGPALDVIERLIDRVESDAALFAESPATGRNLVPDAELPDFHNREKWFGDGVARELRHALRVIKNQSDDDAKRFALCAFSAVIVSVSNQESETRWCARPKDLAPGEALRRLAARLRTSLLMAYELIERSPILGPTWIARSDARSLPFRSASIGFVVTSPPYANSHDYYLYNKLRLFWLGANVREVQEGEFGSRNKHSDLGLGIDHYLDAMAAVLREVHRVLVPGAAAAFVVADAVVRQRLYDAAGLLVPAATDIGLRLEDHFRFEHTTFNASFQRGFGTSRRKTTHVLVWRK